MSSWRPPSIVLKEYSYFPTIIIFWSPLSSMSTWHLLLAYKCSRHSRYSWFREIMQLFANNKTRHLIKFVCRTKDVNCCQPINQKQKPTLFTSKEEKNCFIRWSWKDDVRGLQIRCVIQKRVHLKLYTLRHFCSFDKTISMWDLLNKKLKWMNLNQFIWQSDLYQYFEKWHEESFLSSIMYLLIF